MQFDLKDLNPGKKFYLDKAKKQYVSLRLPSNAFERSIKSLKDGEEKERKRIDYIITNWNIKAGGKAIPCDADHKWKLYAEKPEFMFFVDKKLQGMAAELVEIEKNL